MHVIAAKAVAFREALLPGFKGYCEQIVRNASVLADSLADSGFEIVSGGTDNHLFLLSLVGRDTSGKDAQAALEQAGVTANKNMVPFDPRKPMVTSGVRIGTPAVTTRGMNENEMVKASSFITRALEGYRDESTLRAVREDVEKLCRRFPLYADRWSEQD
jgi:glycine hydroxymethyltransferase